MQLPGLLLCRGCWHSLSAAASFWRFRNPSPGSTVLPLTTETLKIKTATTLLPSANSSHKNLTTHTTPVVWIRLTYTVTWSAFSNTSSVIVPRSLTKWCTVDQPVKTFSSDEKSITPPFIVTTGILHSSIRLCQEFCSSLVWQTSWRVFFWSEKPLTCIQIWSPHNQSKPNTSQKPRFCSWERETISGHRHQTDNFCNRRGKKLQATKGKMMLSTYSQ